MCQATLRHRRRLADDARGMFAEAYFR